MSGVWLLLALLAAGALAELVDGTLGMGFGVTNTSLLLTMGVAPAAASAFVHSAEMATSLASGASHLRLGNVDRARLPWLAVPGCAGGVLGAMLLVGADPKGARGFVSLFLLLMGALIVSRFIRRKRARLRRLSKSRTGALGFVAAALDAFGGGGWGPIATPGLMLSEGEEPRKAIGTVNLAEFFVTCAIAVTFILILGPQAVRWDLVAAVAVGGVLCAPVGALLARRVKAPVLGGAVGALLVILNARVLAVEYLGADARLAAAFTVCLLGATLGAMAMLSRPRTSALERAARLERFARGPSFEFRVEREWRAQ